MSPAGRRPGSPDTREEILSAARRVFSRLGYDRGTIRTIASEAGVDPALVHHYFGTKDRLYSASISIPFGPGEIVREVFGDGIPPDAGERLARIFFTIWEYEVARGSLMGILRSAMSGEEQAVTAFREFIVSAVKGNIARALGHDDAEMRALCIAGQLVGLAIVRYVVRVEPVASASVDEIVALIGPRIQSYLT